MANFNDVLTTEGQRFLMKMISGEIGPIKFTRVVLGDGNTSESLANVKELVNPICESTIEGVTISSRNDVTITSVFTNEHITEGFYMREKGIYASDGTTEVLILYANSGSQAQWIKPAAADVYEKVMRSIILFSQSDNVNIELKNDGYANAIDFEKHIENNYIHITDEERQKWNEHIKDKNNPHNVTKTQVGLGNVPNVTTNNQTPSYTEANNLENITSGEKISVSLGKIKKAITTLISHITQLGTASALGHVKLSDTYASKITNGAAANGLGASQNALYNAYNKLNTDLSDILTKGDNWAEVMFGTYSNNGNYYATSIFCPQNAKPIFSEAGVHDSSIGEINFASSIVYFKLGNYARLYTKDARLAGKLVLLRWKYMYS